MKNTRPKVKWSWDMGCYVPFCPYCNELAYEKDHCVFCEKEYKWVGKSKERIVAVGEYTVCQASNNHITIVKDGRMVLHASCTKRMSKRQLKEMVDFYERATSDEWLYEAEACAKGLTVEQLKEIRQMEREHAELERKYKEFKEHYEKGADDEQR